MSSNSCFAEFFAQIQLDFFLLYDYVYVCYQSKAIFFDEEEER